MSNYKPEFSIEQRTTYVDDKKQKCVAPFVSMPDGSLYNIWDIPIANYNLNIEAAIKHAFKLGIEAAKMQMVQSMTGINVE